MVAKPDKSYLIVVALFVLAVLVVASGFWYVGQKHEHAKDITEIDPGSYLWVNSFIERCPDVLLKVRQYMEDGMISQREYYALSDMTYKVCTEPRLLKYKGIVEEKVK